MEATPSSAPLTMADRKAAAAATRAQVLGSRNVPAALLKELSQLLPMSQVRVEHVRHTDAGMVSGRERADIRKRRGGVPFATHPQGGITWVKIQSGEIQVLGDATCSLTENYNRRRGIAIAFGRAMKQLREQSKSPIGLSGASAEDREARIEDGLGKRPPVAAPPGAPAGAPAQVGD